MAASDWRNRITRYGEEAPDQLIANPRNWRSHPGSQADALRGVLQDVGVVQNVLANERTGYLIDGHLRVMEALKSGQPTVPVTWVDLSEEEEALILATLDPLAAMAGTDAAQLDALLREVSTDSPALQAMLDELAQEAGIVPGIEEGGGGDDFDTTPDEGPTRTQLGDLWLIGGVHRLLVGDCTDAGNVARLMDGEEAQATITDPPYNVDAAGSTRDPRDEKNYGKGSRIENDSMSDAQFLGFLQASFNQIDVVLAPGGALYVFHPDRYSLEFRLVARDMGWHMPQTIIWVKDNFVFGRNDYHPQHEQILYGWKQGAAHHAVADRTQSTVWDVAVGGRHEDHPTEKPLGVVQPAVENSTNTGDIVIDFFAGTGPLLIAAHRLGRRAYLMELDPRYADVILRRAEAEGLVTELIPPMVRE